MFFSHFFLNYRHFIEYIFYVKRIDSNNRNFLIDLWYDVFRVKWGLFFRLRNVAKCFDIVIENPLFLLFRMLFTLLITPLINLNILYVVLIGNICLNKRPSGDTIVMA